MSKGSLEEGILNLRPEGKLGIRLSFWGRESPDRAGDIGSTKLLTNLVLFPWLSIEAFQMGSYKVKFLVNLTAGRQMDLRKIKKDVGSRKQRLW